MKRLVIKFCDFSAPAACTLCGTSADVPVGPCLCQAGSEQPLCRDCSKRTAPHLLALLDLASAADRVGRTCRYVVPPMEALLDLARAAENYSACKEKQAAVIAPPIASVVPNSQRLPLPDSL